VDQLQAGGGRVCRLTPEALDILVNEQSLCQVRARQLTSLCAGLFAAATDADRLLELSGLWAPLQPVTLLPLAADPTTPLTARILLAAQMIHRAYLDKIRRCLLLVKVATGGQGNVDSETQAVRELQQVRSTRWSPSKFPEWALFEVEQGITIRDIQADVAVEMMGNCEQPGDSTSASTSYCLQLNMGEGKTSVILPIICASWPMGTSKYRA